MSFDKPEFVDAKFPKSKMRNISSICQYCFDERQVSADRTQWLIHLSKHREDIIKSLCLMSDLCLFCAYAKPFSNRIEAASHYRWEHKRSTLLEWAFKRLPGTIII